jgi:hypothetical protein
MIDLKETFKAGRSAMTSSAQEAAQNEGAREDAQPDAAGAIRENARDIATAAGKAVASRKNIAADYLGAVAGAIDRGARELADKGRSDSASLAQSASEQLGSLAKTISEREPRQLLGDLQDFARRQPALCFGIAALAGFGLLRFLKSSSGHAKQEEHELTSARVGETAPASETWRH